MLRLIFFLFGSLLGFIAAIFVLPIPGKTFFNRVARLPKGAQDLIDDSIDLSVSFVRLATVFLEDVNLKLSEFTKTARNKANEIREGLETSQKIAHEIRESDHLDEENANSSIKAGL